MPEASLVANSSPPLRLYAGREAGGELSPHMSLSQFYYGFFRPVILLAQRAAKRNVDQYDQSISYWARFTQDPPLCQIDDRMVGLFMESLVELPGKKAGEPISDNTIIKHCIHLQAVIDRAGPRGRTKSTRKAQRLIAEVPYFERPVKRDKLPEDDFTLAEITAILRACRGCETPRYLKAPREREIWWRELLIGDFNLGLRIGSATRIEWARIRQDRTGWYATVVVKGRKEQRVYCNPAALQSFEFMRPITGHLPHVWHWPHGQHWLQEQRRRILAEADIPPERRLGFHALRKAMCTHAAEINPMAATFQAGHTSEKTTRDSYVNRRIVATAMDQLPQPQRPQDERQQRLF